MLQKANLQMNTCFQAEEGSIAFVILDITLMTQSQWQKLILIICHNALQINLKLLLTVSDRSIYDTLFYSYSINTFTEVK